MTKTIYIKTFGCSINQADTEAMVGLLEEAGFKVITNYGIPYHEWKKNPQSKLSFDLAIINTCSVKNLAESKFWKEFNKFKSQGKKVIVAGCIPQAEPELLHDSLKDIPIIGTRQLLHTVDIVKSALSGRIIQNINNDYNDRLDLPNSRNKGIIEILPISEGCLSNCSYCKTKLARGELLSYPREKIIERFKRAVDQGCKEIWITSQDNGCYGFDSYRKEKYFLPQLLNDMLKIKGEYKVRLGMANPDNIKRIKDDLIQVFKHPKIFKFLHIPIQSGNDRILRLMKRSYAIKDYESIIDDFKKQIPDISISTDIIVGFASETEKEFVDSINLLKRTRPDVVNLSRFWLRKNTPAEKLKHVHGNISKIRSEKMQRILQEISLDNNKRWIGKECNVLIDDIGKNNTLIGRNDSYKQVILRNCKHDIGEFVKVKIREAGIYDLRA